MKSSRFLSMLAIITMASFFFVSCEEEDNDDNDSSEVVVNKDWRYEYADEDGNKCYLTELADNGSYFTFSEKYGVVGQQYVVSSTVFHYDKNGKVTSIDEIIECSADYFAEEVYEEALSYYGSDHCTSIDRNGNTITCKGIVDEDYNNVRTKQDVYDYFNDYLDECLNGSNDDNGWVYEYPDEDGYKCYLTEITDNGTSLSYSEKVYMLGDQFLVETTVFQYNQNEKIISIDDIVKCSADYLVDEIYEYALSLGSDFCSSVTVSGNTITIKGIIDEDYNNVRTKQDVYDYYNSYVDDCLHDNSHGGNVDDGKKWTYEYTDENGYQWYLTDLTEDGSSIVFSEKCQTSIVWYVCTHIYEYNKKGDVTSITYNFEFSSESLAKETYDELISGSIMNFSSVVRSGKTITAVYTDNWGDKNDAVVFYESYREKFSKIK